MVCTHCGKDIPLDNMTFCIYCGEPFTPDVSCQYVSKERVNEAFLHNEYNRIWDWINSGKCPYAEYRYELLIKDIIAKVRSREDFKLAMGKISNLTEKGNTFACYILGYATILAHDSYTKTSMWEDSVIKRGMAYVEQSEGEGLPCAERLMGSFYYHGFPKGVADRPVNLRAAFRSFTRAVEAGNIMAMRELALMYSDGNTVVPQNKSKADSLFKKAAFFDCPEIDRPEERLPIDMYQKHIEHLILNYNL